MKLSRFSIFRMPNTYKRFDYTPRHFDPAQEERDKRRKQLEAEREIDVSAVSGKTISFRGGLRNNRSEYKSQAVKSNVRIIVILGILFMTVYYLFYKYDILGTLTGGAVNQ